MAIAVIELSSPRARVGATSLVAGPSAFVAVAAESSHGQGVVGERSGFSDEVAEKPIVASARHVQMVADRSFLRAGEAPPRTLEVENRALAR
jgi:hypothetical protein